MIKTSIFKKATIYIVIICYFCVIAKAFLYAEGYCNRFISQMVLETSEYNKKYDEIKALIKDYIKTCDIAEKGAERIKELNGILAELYKQIILDAALLAYGASSMAAIIIIPAPLIAAELFAIGASVISVNINVINGAIVRFLQLIKDNASIWRKYKMGDMVKSASKMAKRLSENCSKYVKNQEEFKKLIATIPDLCKGLSYDFQKIKDGIGYLTLKYLSISLIMDLCYDGNLQYLSDLIVEKKDDLQLLQEEILQSEAELFSLPSGCEFEEERNAIMMHLEDLYSQESTIKANIVELQAEYDETLKQSLPSHSVPDEPKACLCAT